MYQNVIAVIWDFDKTLINGYMQEPIFKKYGIDEKKFWDEVNSGPKEYEKQGIRVNRDTYYLNHILEYVKIGKLKDLSNKILFDLGSELEFCDGLPELFKELKESVVNDDVYKKYDIKLEHYIVSTGLIQMIKGSKIAEHVDGIWGCEFSEETIKNSEDHDTKVISQIVYAIDNTTKTRAIFEINKGINVFDQIDVNSKVPEENKRIPIKNMVYIADGPSDVPVFSVVKKNGGMTFAVYRKGNEKEFLQVDQLRQDGRVDMFGEADYRKDTLTYMWLTKEIKRIAHRIYKEHEDDISKGVSKAPRHIT